MIPHLPATKHMFHLPLCCVLFHQPGAARQAKAVLGWRRGDRMRDAQELGHDGDRLLWRRSGACHGHGPHREIEPVEVRRMLSVLLVLACADVCTHGHFSRVVRYTIG